MTLCKHRLAQITFIISEIQEAVGGFEWFDLFPAVNWADVGGWCLKDGWAPALLRCIYLHIGTWQRVMHVTSWKGERGEKTYFYFSRLTLKRGRGKIFPEIGYILKGGFNLTLFISFLPACQWLHPVFDQLSPLTQICMVITCVQVSSPPWNFEI